MSFTLISISGVYSGKKTSNAVLVHEIKIKWWEKTDLQLAVWYPDSLSVKNTTFSKF